MYEDQANGASPRVSFGPKEWQSMQLEVASLLLTLWRERAPATFGAYLAEVLTGTKPSGRKAQLCTSASFIMAGHGAASRTTCAATTALNAAPPSTKAKDSTSRKSTKSGMPSWLRSSRACLTVTSSTRGSRRRGPPR